MTARWDHPCGCAHIKAGDRWYQVVCCPDHVMDMRPHDEVPDPRPIR